MWIKQRSRSSAKPSYSGCNSLKRNFVELPNEPV